MTQPSFGPAAGTGINLNTFEKFQSHAWVHNIIEQYAVDAILAKHAVARLLKDLDDINTEHIQDNQRTLFTTVEGRVKAEASLLRKLYRLCFELGKSAGVTQDTVLASYRSIIDLCGVRFACPYFDEIKAAIENLVRPRLAKLGYATNLDGHSDRDLLEDGDDHGYRSYHFWVSVPTPVNIYGDVKLCICEVQARSELQHVWAVKSHDLLYKPDYAIHMSDRHVVDDMRQISNHLRAADQFFVSIRDRIRRTT